MLRRVLVFGWDKFGPLAKQSKKLSSTGERVVAAIFGDVVLGTRFVVCLACSGVVADLYHQQLNSHCVQCELCSLGVCPR
ncbi:hypothetical protein Taro_044276 [Colocasia esculenta]|uniref:Uncharacterized protein n=1 Tax=Colocasia esculenta TaxID=4460 RepID=A0A843X596_COLES|nr:hypothetical protein [Colocasia esculenta]